MDDFKAILQTRGFRATPGRIALLKTLSATKRPLTVDEIGLRLDLNLVTLYRALNDLAEKGLLLRGNANGGVTHYSYPKNHHHHLVCSDCGLSSRCAVC